MRTKLLIVLSFLIYSAIFAQGIGGTHVVTQIADGIYTAEPKFGGANATIIVNDKEVVIVDSHSSSAAAKAVLAEVRAITDKPIKYVINTHWHGDHHGGNRAFYEAFGESVIFISHQNTREDIKTLATEELKRFASFYTNFYKQAEEALNAANVNFTAAQKKQIETYIQDEKAFVEGVQTYEYVLPTITIDENAVLHTSSREIQLLYFGKAHTRGDLVVYLPKEKLMITGDLLTAPYIVPRSGFPKSYAKTLRAIAELDFDQYVLGHGGPIKKETSFILLMAEFLEATAEHAVQTASLSFEKSFEKAKSNSKLQSFNQRIDWNEPGLRMLDFDRLLQMTLARAYNEVKELP